MENNNHSFDNEYPENQPTAEPNETSNEPESECSYHYGQYSTSGRPPVSDDTGTGAPDAEPGASGQPQYSSYTQYAPAPPAKKKKRGLTAFIAVCVAVMVAIGGMSIGYIAGKKSLSQPENGSSSYVGDTQSENKKGSGGSTSSFSIDTSDGSNNRSLTYEQVIASVSDSIVSITVYNADGTTGSYASGIIMNADEGYVVTNDHIYETISNAKFLITLRNGTEFKADFVSGDSRNDISILKIQNPQGLTAATFSTENATVGEEVLAIGMSAGLSGTITQGIVSAVDRRVRSGSYSEKFIQTTAAINPGNSGGALVNMSGKVIGITSSKYVDANIEGICFAIPTTRALGVIEQLQKNGKVTGRAKLGITYTAITTVSAELNNLPTGLLLQNISNESELSDKGFSKGDVITRINGQKITTDSQVLDIIDAAKAGDSVTLSIYKASSKTTSDVTIHYIEDEGYTNYTTGESSPYNSNNPYDLFPDGESQGQK